MQQSSRRLLVVLPALLLALTAFPLLAACDDNDEPGNGEPVAVTVQAEVEPADAPVQVDVSAIEEDGDGLLFHEVRVTWEGDQPVVLEDARFTHDATSNDGRLITAGRGCGASWDEDMEQVLLACTSDLQIIWLEPDQTHNYPVRIYPQVGPQRLAPGTYAIEELVRWWYSEGPAEPFPEIEDGEFTIRLRYETSR